MKLAYSNAKMKADERHLKQFKRIQNDRKKIETCKTELCEGDRVVARESVYTQKPLNTDAFKHRRLFTQMFLHTDAFTHRHFYTQTLLHKDPFTYINTYIHTYIHTSIHTYVHTYITHKKYKTYTTYRTDITYITYITCHNRT